MHRAVKHAEHGVLAWKCNTVLHTGTHLNAPINHIQRGADLSEIPVERFFGNGVVLDIPKGSYEVVTAADLSRRCMVTSCDRHRLAPQSPIRGVFRQSPG